MVKVPRVSLSRAYLALPTFFMRLLRRLDKYDRRGPTLLEAWGLSPSVSRKINDKILLISKFLLIHKYPACKGQFCWKNKESEV